MASFSLLRYNGPLAIQSDTVSWSSDGRIAVLANEVLYILTLKCLSADARWDSTPPLPVSISTISAPSLPSLAAPVKPLRQLVALLDQTEEYDVFLDPKLNMLTSGSHFVSAQWSPIRCSRQNRCLITAVTNSSRILFYEQKSSNHWRMILDLSGFYYQLLVKANFKMEALNEQQTAASLDSVTFPKNSREHIVEYRRQQSLLVIQAIAWLPVLLNEQKEAVFSFAVRGNFIVLWSLQVPYTSNSSPTPEVLSVISLPVTTDGWVSSLQWTVSTANVYYLSVGYTSGQLILLEWTGSLRSETYQIYHLCTSDGMSISNMKWSCSEGKDWLSFSKGPYLLTVPLFRPLPKCVLLKAAHSLPVTGVSVLCNNDVISCSLDGSVSRQPLPNVCLSGDSHVIVTAVEESSPILLGIKLTKFSCSGIATSENSLFAAVHVHAAFSFGKRTSQLLLVPLCSLNNTGFVNLLETENCSWDMYEYLRLSPTLWGTETTEPPWPLMIQRQIAILSRKEKEHLLEIETKLLVEQSRKFLKEFLKWSGSLDDSQSILSLSNSAVFLLTHSEHNDTANQLLANKVLKKISDHSVEELCPLCHYEVISCTGVGGVCYNDHRWDRCVLTQLVITSISDTLTCSTCQSHALSCSDNTKGEWLAHASNTFITCPLCGSYFESSMY